MKITRFAPACLLLAFALGYASPKKAPPVSTLPTAKLPDPNGVSAKSAAILDGDTGRVLWGKDPDQRMFPASTTKIMTALLLLEHTKPEDVITAPKDVNTVGESSMHLQPFEQLTARNLLWGILLRSGNDGCYDAAVYLAGSVPEFAKMMNDRAAAIGCTHTHFTNPNGLHDPQHWTSAHDLTLMAREAFKDPTFAEMVRTPKHQIARSINQKDLWMVSRNKYLKIDPTADGVKTGYTVPAGHTYVGSATRGGHRIITAILKSDHWEFDHQAMLHWAFANFDHVTIAKKGDHVGEVPITGGSQPNVTGELTQDVEDCVAKGSTSVLNGEFHPAHTTAPIEQGQVLGEEVYSDATGFTIRVPVVASASLAKAVSVHSNARTTSYYVIGSSLCLGLIWYRSRTRRSRFYGNSNSGKGKLSPF